MAYNIFRGMFPTETQQSKTRGVGPSDLLHGKLAPPPPEMMASHQDTRVPPREWKVTGGHPKGVSEGPVEQAVKMMGGKYGSLVPDDNPYLEQYFHPEHDILEPQLLRPTITSGKNEDLPYRRLGISGWETSKTGLMKDKVQLNMEGLGNYTVDPRNPNYDSIYDVWDFDTNSPLTVAGANAGPGAIIPNLYEHIAKTFMKKAGTPYAVYDRIPKGTIYDAQPKKK